MVKTFAKPPAARQVEARARARQLGVRVAVVSEARRYVTASQSTPGTLYAQERTPAGWACSCEGYLHTGMCKHLGAVERRSARERWRVGQVAPLATVGRYFPLGDDPQPEPPAPAVLADSAKTQRQRAALADLYGDAA